jgi:hypothetical protein
MTLYKNLHASRCRNCAGRDVWQEALTYLGKAVRRKNGNIWLKQETKRLSKLPWPYERIDKAKPPQKKRLRSAWSDDVARSAEANGLDISEQVGADKEARW